MCRTGRGGCTDGGCFAVHLGENDLILSGLKMDPFIRLFSPVK